MPGKRCDGHAGAARWFAIPLWQRIFAALVLGAVVGMILGEDARAIQWVGELFVRLIRMLVTPLVFLTISSGVASLASPKRLGGIGIKTLAMYLLTSALAVVVGLIVASIIQPGLGADFANVVPRVIAAPRNPMSVFISIVPSNPIQAMAEGNVLAVVFFAVLVGAGIVVAGDPGEPVRRLLDSGSTVMLRIVGFVMETAPFGVFALMAAVIGANGAAAFVNVFKLAICVVIGSAIQTLFVHGAVVRFGAWLPVRPFFRGIADAIMVGFSTASSSATLPVAIRVAERNLGIKPSIASTVLPLGATIGMDGAAMYVGMLTLFAAQAFGLTLGPSDYMLILVTTTIVAMGVAPVPSGSLFVLAAVLGAIGINPGQTAILIGFVLPFDRILDMTRTIPNVTTDLACATAIARWEGEIDVDVYNARAKTVSE